MAKKKPSKGESRKRGVEAEPNCDEEDDPSLPSVQSWLKSLCVGSEVDAVDSGDTMEWIKARVVEVDEGAADGYTLKVHFVGFHKRFDCWVERSAPPKQ